MGAGSNGKSVYLKGLESAIGEDNVSNIPLHTLTDGKDRFSRAGLVGKLVNIYADLSDKELNDTSAFKAITGEDSIMVEYKGKQAFKFNSFARLIFSANNKVCTQDESTGYKRQLFMFHFSARFQLTQR